MLNKRYMTILSLSTLACLSLAVSSIFLFSNVEPKQEEIKEEVIDKIVMSNYKKLSSNKASVDVHVLPVTESTTQLNCDLYWDTSFELDTNFSLDSSPSNYLNVEFNKDSIIFTKKEQFGCPIIFDISYPKDESIKTTLKFDCKKIVESLPNCEFNFSLLNKHKPTLNKIYPVFSQGTISENEGSFSYKNVFIDKKDENNLSLFNQLFSSAVDDISIDKYLYNDKEFDTSSILAKTNLENEIKYCVKQYIFSILDFDRNEKPFTYKDLKDLLEYKTIDLNGNEKTYTLALEEENVDKVNLKPFTKKFNEIAEQGCCFKTSINYSNNKLAEGIIKIDTSQDDVKEIIGPPEIIF